MRTRRLVRASLFASVAVGVLSAAPVAWGYPPGTDPVVSTSSSTYAQGENIGASFRNGQPDCPISFHLTGQGVDVVQTVAGGKGGTASTSFAGLTIAGGYNVTAQNVATGSQPTCGSASVATTFSVAAPAVAATATNDSTSNTVKYGGGAALIGIGLMATWAAVHFGQARAAANV